MRRYHVRRHDLVKFILGALESAGASILTRPDPTLAPFTIGIATPTGERMRLICYAFTANKYRQANRPPDEHRFQVKYGSEFKAYHAIHIAEKPGEVTLFFGAHLEEKIFVACDPEMHRWTRFSRSIEFKTEHVEQAKESGWYGWERERSDTRRMRTAPKDDCRTEVLLGFTPERFLRYVSFERIATGLDPGERLLLVDKLRDEKPSPPGLLVHPLEIEFGIPAAKILDIIGDAFRLRAAVRGSVAEHKLGQLLHEMRGIDRVRKIDEDGKPDFEVVYRGRPVLIECKNTLRKRTAAGLPKVDFQKTRAAKGNPCSRYYLRDQFHILAACLHPVTESWDFKFCRTAMLAQHSTCEGRLSQNVTVGGPVWTAPLPQLLEELTSSAT